MASVGMPPYPSSSRGCVSTMINVGTVGFQNFVLKCNCPTVFVFTEGLASARGAYSMFVGLSCEAQRDISRCNVVTDGNEVC